jgi:uncharacterized membrane protein YagU involved in acid resistance
VFGELIAWLSDWLVDWLTWCLMPPLTVCQLYRSATTATFLTDNTMAKRNKKTNRQKLTWVCVVLYNIYVFCICICTALLHNQWFSLNMDEGIIFKICFISLLVFTIVNSQTSVSNYIFYLISLCCYQVPQFCQKINGTCTAAVWVIDCLIEWLIGWLIDLVFNATINSMSTIS